MTFRALIIDGSEDLRVLIAQLIAMEWPDAVVDESDPPVNGEPAFPSLVGGAHDVVLLGHTPEQPDSLSWLEDLRDRPDTPPVLVITESVDPQVAATAIELGAHACLPRHHMTPARLQAAVKTALAAREKTAVEDATTLERTQLIHTQVVKTQALDESSAGRIVAPAGGPLARSPVADVLELPRISGYRLIGRLAVGGMSILYLGYNLGQGVTQVLKVLDGELLADDDFLDLFLQEYRLIANLRSPYVVRIYDQGFADFHVYISMEYLCGGDLKDRIRRRAFSADEAVAIFLEIARALDVIHTHGLVHRDLKPQNVMFRQDGSLALVDFGIANRVDMKTPDHGAMQTAGSPYYMSPEQCAGRPTDHRTDLYSAGVILYEMMTGAKLYTGRALADVLDQHSHALIPRLSHDLSPYQTLLDRLLAKRPGDRYRDARELLDATHEVARFAGVQGS